MRYALQTIAAVLAISAWSGSQPTSTQTFVGVITDSQCAYNVHSNSRSHKEWSEVHDNMDARQCTIMCVEDMGGAYVFLDQDGKTVYKLDSKKETLKALAGKKVKVAGTLDAEKHLIAVSKIEIIETKPKE